MPVNRFVVQKGSVLEFDILTASESHPQLTSIPNGTEINDTLESLVRNVTDLKLYVKTEESALYFEMLQTQLLSAHATANRSQKDSAFADLIRGSYSEALETSNTETIYDSSKINGTNIAIWFSSNPSLRNIFNVLDAPYSWYTNAIHTAILCSYYAYKMGVKERTLVEFAQAALLADIGYLDVDQALMNSTKDLLPNQLRKLQIHTTHGLKRLAQIESTTWLALMMAYQHHERLDRKGYPTGIPGDLITDGAKMYAIVDRFMHHCGKKHRFEPELLQSTLEKMEPEVGSYIAEGHFQCWKSIVQTSL